MNGARHEWTNFSCWLPGRLVLAQWAVFMRALLCLHFCVVACPPTHPPAFQSSLLVCLPPCLFSCLYLQLLSYKPASSLNCLPACQAANILITDEFEAKVADFGFSRFMDAKQKRHTDIVFTHVSLQMVW